MSVLKHKKLWDSRKKLYFHKIGFHISNNVTQMGLNISLGFAFCAQMILIELICRQISLPIGMKDDQSQLLFFVLLW